jgi:hypothetical protein
MAESIRRGRQLSRQHRGSKATVVHRQASGAPGAPTAILEFPLGLHWLDAARVHSLDVAGWIAGR